MPILLVKHLLWQVLLTDLNLMAVEDLLAASMHEDAAKPRDSLSS